MSDSRRILISSPSTLISVPEYLPNSTSSPSVTPIGERSPESRSLPGPTAITLPRCGFSLAVSGSTMPPAVFSSASICWITTRSSSGRILAIVGTCLFAFSRPPEGGRGGRLVRWEESTPWFPTGRFGPGLHHPHAAHAAHAAHATHARAMVVVVPGGLGLLLGLGDDGLGGQEEAGDGRGVLEGG